jgi:hypothetical protein
MNNFSRARMRARPPTRENRPVGQSPGPSVDTTSVQGQPYGGRTGTLGWGGSDSVLFTRTLETTSPLLAQQRRGPRSFRGVDGRLLPGVPLRHGPTHSTSSNATGSNSGGEAFVSLGGGPDEEATGSPDARHVWDTPEYSRAVLERPPALPTPLSVTCDPCVSLALGRLEHQMKRELASAVLLLRDQITDVAVTLSEERVGRDAMNRRFEQQAFLLREEILCGQQRGREEAAVLERNLLNRSAATVGDAFAVAASNELSRSDGLRDAVAGLEGKMSALVDRVAGQGDLRGSVGASQIAARVVEALKSAAIPVGGSAAQKENGYFDCYGNLVDETLFVRDLEFSLLRCVTDFLPPPN